jgi:hypothetical protein
MMSFRYDQRLSYTVTSTKVQCKISYLAPKTQKDRGQRLVRPDAEKALGTRADTCAAAVDETYAMDFTHGQPATATKPRVQTISDAFFRIPPAT